MTRKEIILFYRNLLNGKTVAGRPIFAANELIDPQSVKTSAHYFGVIAGAEQLSVGLNGMTFDRVIPVVLSGYTRPIAGQELFSLCEDVVEGVIDIVTDPANYTTCVFGPSSISIVTESSAEVDRVAHMAITLTVEFLDGRS